MKTAFLLLLGLLGPACFGTAAPEPALAAMEERGTAVLQGSPSDTVDHDKDAGMMTTPFGKIRRNPSAATKVRNGLSGRGKAPGDGCEIVLTPFGPVKRGITNQGKDRE